MWGQGTDKREGTVRVNGDQKGNQRTRMLRMYTYLYSQVLPLPTTHDKGERDLRVVEY